jgi:hypothetical protein
MNTSANTQVKKHTRQTYVNTRQKYVRIFQKRVDVHIKINVNLHMELKNYQEILRNKLKKHIELRNVKVFGKMVYAGMGSDVSFYIINV